LTISNADPSRLTALLAISNADPSRLTALLVGSIE
jgi:hypothetical protein